MNIGFSEDTFLQNVLNLYYRGIPPMTRMYRDETPMDRREIAKYAERWTTCRPVAISHIMMNGEKMCQVVATRNLKKGKIVAVYPIVIESDEKIDDAMYAIAIMKKHSYQYFDNISGIPSKKAFQQYEKKELNIPPIGMYLNEPCQNQIANCDFIFPSFKSVNPERLVGKYAEGYIRTTKQVAIGEPLTWCYGCMYARNYTTSCSNQC